MVGWLVSEYLEGIWKGFEGSVLVIIPAFP
jgi:hypothetical protein